MIDYLTQRFDVPVIAVTTLIIVLLTVNVIGELLEFKGKVVPEFCKMRKYFARKKQERETLAKIPETIESVKRLVDDVNRRCSEDDIAARNKWVDEVNHRLDGNERAVEAIKDKIDKNGTDLGHLRDDIVHLLIDNKRDTIINFAEKVSDDSFPVTREQFTRIDRIYQEYERIIHDRNLTNGEIEIAYKIIKEGYQIRLRNHSFVEDVRWHGLELG